MRTSVTLPMPELPTPHAAAALIVTIAAFAAFVSSRLRIELVCLVVIAVLAIGFYAFPIEPGGRLTGMEVAFGGFGHPALVAICCLMILGRGLVMTGALEPAARVLARIWQFSHALGMFSTLLVCMVISGFVNDTPVLVLMLPILLNLAQRAGVPASKTLMPVNFAILIGGMATTIGTSTNVLVVSIATELDVPPFGVFSFLPLVAVAAAAAFPYLWLVAPRLLPSVVANDDTSPRHYHAMLHVTEKSTVVGKDPVEVTKGAKGDLELRHVLRYGRQLGDGPIAPGDLIAAVGTITALRDASDSLRAPLASERVMSGVDMESKTDGEDTRIAELAIGGDSRLVGKSVREARIADRFGVIVLGTYRAAPAYFLRRTLPVAERLDVGDVLLVQGTNERLLELERSEGTMVLRDVLELPRTAKAPLALAITGAAILLAAVKVLPIAIAALAGTIAMLATGCVRFENIGRALSVEVIVLVAASIALGRALEETGGATWLASLLAIVVSDVAPAFVLGGLMAFAMVLTNFVSNTAAAAITTPLAVSLGRQLGIPPEPLVLAVLFGCNLCYITPMAYQTNLLIMGAAGYRFVDFVKVGAPLALLMISTLAYLLVHRFSL
jgi:di/tricarboxylate transporter